MFRSSILCHLARRVLPLVVALTFLAPMALASPRTGTRVEGDSKSRVDLGDHVRVGRNMEISPDG